MYRNDNGRMKRAGLLGGTFDPIHLGHIDIASDAATELELDKVILMPTFVQPFKAGHYTATPEDRLEMCMVYRTLQGRGV